MLLFKKPVAYYHNWFALPERPISDAHATICLAGVFEDGSEHKCHEERSSNKDGTFQTFEGMEGS